MLYRHIKLLYRNRKLWEKYFIQQKEIIYTFDLSILEEFKKLETM